MRSLEVMKCPESMFASGELLCFEKLFLRQIKFFMKKIEAFACYVVAGVILQEPILMSCCQIRH